MENLLILDRWIHPFQRNIKFTQVGFQVPIIKNISTEVLNLNIRNGIQFYIGSRQYDDYLHKTNDECHLQRNAEGKYFC